MRKIRYWAAAAAARRSRTRSASTPASPAARLPRDDAFRLSRMHASTVLP